MSEWDLVVIGGCHTYILHQILSISSIIMNTLPILLVLDGMVKVSVFRDI